MNKLWVRLTLMIGGTLFAVFFAQFLSIMLDTDRGMDVGAPPREVVRRLFNFMGLSALVGLVGGAAIGRYISTPISHLAEAAERVGKGDLNARVPVRGSQEIQALATAFNRMAADLQHAETLRKNMMADVSHELRTPLTVLEGNLRAALDEVYKLDEAEIASLYGQTAHLIRLVNDLRELALAESRQIRMEKQPTDVQFLITETIQMLEPLAYDKAVSLVYQPNPLPMVMADEVRIRQVLINLLTNALRHTPTGGQIHIAAALNGRVVQICIRDTGDGIAPDQLAFVFERFYRADKSRSRETGGTGLGLAIVKAIIEAHGGQVSVHSAGLGQGSQFVLSLPA